MKRMKIAYDHQIFGWQKYGGISRYFYELAQNIATLEGVDVRVVSPLYVNEYLAKSGFPVGGIRAPQIRRTGRIYRALNQLLVPSALRRFNPDIIHETYYSFHGAAPKHSRVVITVHDMIHELFPESFSLWDKTSSEKAAAARRADHIICVSENTRKDLIRLLDIDPVKTSVVYHGFELLAPPSGGRHVKSPYILYVGSRSGYKNFVMLLKAFASLPFLMADFELVAFGGGAFRADEQSLIHELGGGKIKARQISGDDELLADLYAGASAFVYPSVYEGFGIPPLEAMSCGCPVICANTSSLPEVVGSAAKLFDPSSADSLMDALSQVLLDSSGRKILIERGKDQVKLFSWQKCAQETLSIYQALLA